MNCAKVTDLLFTDYTDKALASELKKQVDEHLSGCVKCRELARVLAQSADALRGGKLEKAPEYLWYRIKDSIIAQESAPVTKPAVRPWWAILGRPAFAVLVMLIMVSAVVIRQGIVLKNNDRLAKASPSVTYLAYLRARMLLER